MPRGIASAKQLAMMARVLVAYCEHFVIPNNDEERDFVALEILALFDEGIRDETALLDEMIKRRAHYNRK